MLPIVGARVPPPLEMTGSKLVKNKLSYSVVGSRLARQGLSKNLLHCVASWGETYLLTHKLQHHKRIDWPAGNK